MDDLREILKTKELGDWLLNDYEEGMIVDPLLKVACDSGKASLQLIMTYLNSEYFCR